MLFKPSPDGLNPTDSWFRKWVGYQDDTGKLVIPPMFDSGRPFRDGMALVRVAGLIGYIDRSGSFAIPPQFASGQDFSEGFAWGIERGACSVPQLCGVDTLQDGRTPAPRGTLRCTYSLIDRRGRIQLRTMFTEVQPFSGGLAAVLVGKRWGYLGLAGDLKISPKFDDAESFVDGVAQVEVGRRRRYINVRGREMVLPPIPVQIPK